ncbi:uncharacterized protein LOC110671471 [Hevea brasiliensis]|uniref:uncharacterized protein LOC110671471 n=1 Tax=Hevea brasiliensis TaxID=3981 RepID=UPI000B79AFCF|nr:uncharacterized protein LOC110671471 [Hevea brasiliensis]
MAVAVKVFNLQLVLTQNVKFFEAFVTEILSKLSTAVPMLTSKHWLWSSCPMETLRHCCTLIPIAWICYRESGSQGIVSYGIMLMETFTRKKPTGEMCLKDWVLDSLQSGEVMNSKHK